LSRGEAGLISSGYSQGLIDDFPQVRAVAEKIAVAIGSTGPLNVQGRVRDGVLVPFEINPRFSASTYLRAMAGFNEVDLYLQFINDGVVSPPPPIRPGYYLRSLSEVYVERDQVIQ
jgi:carbamoyl-phosphate synthase large subunit